MQTTIYTNLTEFDALRDEWTNLLERAVSAPFFMQYSYQRTWWQYLGQGDLMLIAMRAADGQLVGLAPLFRTTNQVGQRQLALIGCVDVSDYLDLLVDENYIEPVHQALLDCLSSDQIVWDKLYLCSLPQNSHTHSRMAELAQARGWQVSRHQQAVCPVITLADSWDNYLAEIDKKQRHEIRRKIGKLERTASIHWYVLESAAEVSAAMDDFIMLHQKSTQDKEDFWNEALIQFFKAMAHEIAKAGGLKLYFIEIDGLRAAAMLCFDYANQFLLYNSGFDPKFYDLSPGNVLTAYTIQEAIRLGRTRYDFLRGDEIYKFRFGAQAEPLYDLEVFRPI